MLTVRAAGRLDTRDMADLLNAIVAQGGTTAISEPLAAADLTAWMAMAPDRSAWHVAEDETGRILGFQFIEPHPDLPLDTCDIASYVRMGETGIGIGSALFNATSAAARALGYRAIIAVIRTDNVGGLAYYQSRGFEDYGRWDEAPIAPRILKRFAL
ncbi:GNAT family N-acetyltransferase [Puniceibacterium sediminis]|uniref:L-amino acid N-acyltransferase YncA n=1 Tax=Puniceibacterium sediminis TaxID=1608407 RepID=A0A238VQL1_9RHOB|nr:GNAT family N-acetyltransferase [Puniceibacterium sediminis]SNR36516.1 L-amino acid N-acyltransferase YncA [Puniceibacterium sediminis]